MAQDGGASKGDVTNETWRQISRGIDDIEEICQHANLIMKTNTEDAYRLRNSYSEIVAWRAILRTTKMVAAERITEGHANNIYGEPLSDNLIGFTRNLTEKQETYFQRVHDGEKPQNVHLVNLNVVENVHVSDLLYDGSGEEDN